MQQALDRKKMLFGIQAAVRVSRHERLTAWFFVIIGLGALFYLSYQPLRALIPMPPCPLYGLTGILCPGCGSTRALITLLNGDLAAAWRFNPMMVVFLPVLLWGAVSQIWIAATGKTLSRIALPAVTGWFILVILILYGIMRNIPSPVFEVIRPGG